MARQDAAPLIRLADKISREAPCAQARDIRALGELRIKLINARKVPASLQDPLSSGVNALVAQMPPCLPAVAAATRVEAPPPPASIVPKHGKKSRHGDHGKAKGKG